jgi:hypothetical protein
MVHSMTGIYWWKMVESEIVLCCFGVGMGRFEVRACGSEQWFARLRRDGFKWRQRLSCSLSIVEIYLRVDMLIELGGR